MTLPFMCVATAIVFVLLVPAALVVAVVVMVKPEIAGMVQANVQKKMVRTMFGHMTKKAAANV